MTGTKSTVFGVSACMLLAGSMVFGRQQRGELSGIHGIPVEGHYIVGGIQFRGTKELGSSRSQRDKFRERLVAMALTCAWGGHLKAKRCVASRRSCCT